jgi:hypothetical protein
MKPPENETAEKVYDLCYDLLEQGRTYAASKLCADGDGSGSAHL